MNVCFVWCVHESHTQDLTNYCVHRYSSILSLDLSAQSSGSFHNVLVVDNYINHHYYITSMNNF